MRRFQQITVRLISAQRDGDTQAVVQRRRDPALDSNVPAADKERGNRSDLGIESRGDAPFDTAQVGLRGSHVLFAGEQQRDVGRHAGENRFLDRRDAGGRSGDLDEQVRPRAVTIQLRGGLHSAGRVVGH
jgi:hypothetical protein